MKKRTQINFNIPPEDHARLKAHVALKGISMNQYIIRAIAAAMNKDLGKK